MGNSPMQVYQAFGQGLMSGTDSWKEVVADDIVFTGPAAHVEGIDAFAELNAGFLPLVRGNEMHRAVESGEFVITQISIDLAAPSGNVITLDMTEWYEVKEGKIQTIKVYYDAEEFRKEMAA